MVKTVRNSTVPNSPPERVEKAKYESTNHPIAMIMPSQNRTSPRRDAICYLIGAEAAE
jgi:hypothetical protein